jgi:hypothetical protein
MVSGWICLKSDKVKGLGFIGTKQEASLTSSLDTGQDVYKRAPIGPKKQTRVPGLLFLTKVTGLRLLFPTLSKHPLKAQD